MKLFNVVIIFLFFLSANAIAQVLDEFGLPDNQSLHFKCIDRMDGLANNNVRSIFQDKQGLIWLGTMNGLSRYDGRNVVNFLYNSTDDQSISSNSIRHITSNSDTSLLYISTSKGLNVLDISTHKFDRRFEQDSLNSLSDFSCFYSYVDKDERIWVGTWGEQKYGYINLIDHGINKKIKLNSTNDLLCTETIFIDHHNEVWVGTRNAGLYRLDYSTHKIIDHYTYNKDDKGSISSNNITSLYEDHQHRLFVLTYNGVNIYDRNTNTFSAIEQTNSASSINKHACISMIEDEHYNLWIGTDSGIYVYQPSLEKYRIILPKSNPKFNAKNSFVQHLFKDKYNNIWICTQLGVLVYNKYANQFGFLDIPIEKTNPTYQLLFSHTRIREGCDQSIWIALDHKYVNYNPKNKTIRSWSDKEIKHTFPKDIAVCDSKGNCFIRSLYANGLYYRSKGSTHTQHLKHSAQDSTSIVDDLLIDSYKDSNDNIWFLSNNNGASKYDPVNHRFKSYSHNSEDAHSLPYNFMYGIQEDHKNKLWLLSWSGLSKYNEKTDNFSNHQVNKFNTIYSIVRDSNLFLLGTTEGLVFYNPEKDSILRIISKANGLADNSVHGIAKDSIGNIWVSTPRGISKIRNHKAIANFYPADGLQKRDFLHEAFLKASDDIIYFGGIDGINYFNPYKVNVNPVKSDIIISSIELNNQPLHHDPRYKNLPVDNLIKEITIDYSDNIIRFEFSAVHFSYAKGCSYRYILEGFDEQWIQVKSNPSANYTNLKPGRYIFKVKASNNHHIWNHQYASIIVNVKPPFWLTFGFKVCCVIMLFLLIYLGYYLKLYLLNKKRQELEQEVAVRTKELKERQKTIEKQAHELSNFANNLKITNKKLTQSNASKDKFFSIIAHDLRSPLASLLGFSNLMVDSLKKDHFSKEKTQHHAQIINSTTKNAYDLLNNLLEWSRAQIGAIPFQPKQTSFKALVDGIQDLFNEQLKSKKIHFSLEYEPHLHLCCDENMINTILRNLISNAIKFTPEEGHITLSACQKDDDIEIAISDTGVGIPQDIQEQLFCIETNTSTRGTNNEAGTGLGLILCNEFVNKHGGEIWVESKTGQGSKFVFTIPIEC